ncbi:MAG: AAA family ATPase [Pseudomonadota bacterium]
MKFASLHLKAFGPFTGAALDLEQGGAGLQIVFGVNEAGKSSALRAVHDLLFGIPARTTDNFVHDNAELRVGAVLVADDGKRYPLMRRKGTKAVLFEFDEKNGEERGDRPIDQARIAQLLPAVDEKLFVMLFGLSHEALRKGGNELLKGESDLGITLFAAGAGLTDVKGAVQALDEEARMLFLPGGSKPKVNAEIRCFEETRKAMRDAFVRPKVWKERDEALLAARAEVDTLESQLRELQASRAKKQRLRDLRPQAVQRENLLHLLAELKDVVKLPEGARANLAAARERVTNARQLIAEAETRINGNRGLLAEIVVSKLHLDAAASIEAQHHTAGSAREGHQQLLALRATLLERQKDIQRLLADLAPATKVEAADKLLPNPAAVTRLKTFVRQLSQAVPARDAAQASGEKADERLQTAESALKDIVAPGDVSALEAAIDAVQRDGEPERALKSASEKLKAIEDDVRRLCVALDHDEATLVSLPLPQKASVERFKKAQQEFDAKASALEAEEEKLQGDMSERQNEIRQLEATGTVVSAATLKAAREHRDKIWEGVRQAYVERSKPAGEIKKKFSLERELSDEYERQVRATDDHADLLHADTVRVTKHAGLRDRIDSMLKTIARIDKDKAELNVAKESDSKAWAEMLKLLKLSPRGPESVLEWLRDRDLAMKRIGERDAAAAEQRTVESTIASGLKTLKTAYKQAGIAEQDLSTLAALLAHARTQLKSAQDRAAKIDSLQKDKKNAARDIATAKAEVAKQNSRIEKLTLDAAVDLKALSLLPAATVEEIDARIDQLEDLANALRAARETEAGISVAKAAWEGFTQGMQALAKQLGIEAPAQSEQYLALASNLYEALAANRKLQARKEALEVAVSADSEQVAGETTKLELAQKSVSELVALAKCAEENGLDAAIDASERARNAQRDLQILDDGLRHFSKEEREELLQTAAAENPDTLQAELSGMNAAIADFDPQIKAAQNKTATAKAELEKIDGSAAAVAARETMEHHAAAIQRDTGEYVRAKLAHALLSKAIRTYQERSQGPLVDRASAWFAMITEKRYTRLVADHDEDARVLLAVRSDGKRLKVSDLSEGTADQLFLALRLAAIEGRLESSPPVPLILDDALLAFDDQRSVAAMKALAKLAKNNQVILFTHHRHIVEIARRELRADEYGTHELKLAELPS